MSTESVPGPVEGRLPTKPPSWLGFAALLGAIATVVIEVAAIAIGSVPLWSVATYLAYVAIGLSILSALAGVISVIVGWRRALGGAAIVVAVLANPLLQVAVLGFLAHS